MSRRIALLAVAAVLPAVAALDLSGGVAAHAGAVTDSRDAAVLELGRRLFFDPALGRQGRIGCSSCHDPEHGFSDPRRFSIDETGPLPRHSQPLTDLGGAGFHWDGEFDTVREIVEARVLPRSRVAANGIERAVLRAEAAEAAGDEWNRDRLRERAAAGLTPVYYGDAQGARSIAVQTPKGESLVDDRLAWSGLYAKGFAAAFGDEKPALDRVVRALDEYVRSLRTTTNAFDRFVAGNERALSPAARHGRDLFVGKAGCAACHVVTPENGVAPLTDRSFHDTGLGWDVQKSEYADRGAGVAHLGRVRDGTFKTPSLRDVARRAPYMHDGRFASLEQVVRYYDEGGTPHAGLDERVKPLGLSDAEVSNLVAFLESLSGDARAGLGSAGPGRPKTLRVRVVDPGGVPQGGVTVDVRSSGDRLAGGKVGAKAVTRRSDADGRISVPWPLATHVSIACPGRSAVSMDLVPDYVESLDFVVLGVEGPLFSLPNGICEDAPVLEAFPADRRSGAAAFTLTHAMRLANGRSLYAPSSASEDIRGRYDLRIQHSSDGVGTYDLADWVWFGDRAELRPSFLPPPQSDALDEGVAQRLAKLLPPAKDGR